MPPRCHVGESALRDAIKDALNATGIVWVETNAKGGRTHRFGLMPDGSADLIGMLRGGYYFALEVKVPIKNKRKVSLRELRSQAQIDWAARVTEWGGFAFKVTSVSEAVAAMKLAKKTLAERAERAPHIGRRNY